jgi:hypothetical protein
MGRCHFHFAISNVMAVAAREGPMAIVEQPIVNGTVGIIEDDPVSGICRHLACPGRVRGAGLKARRASNIQVPLSVLIASFST